MIIKKTEILNCFEICFEIKNDYRGKFVKIFNKKFFIENNLNTDYIDEYYTVSHKGVLRGMHFQLPPHEHYKLVSCLKGRVIDVILDLRNTSNTFGKYQTFLLSEDDAKILYLPPGVAHGFYSLENNSLMHYKVSSDYNELFDAGIKWNSFNYIWPDKNPIISERDTNFISFGSFKSPF